MQLLKAKLAPTLLIFIGSLAWSLTMIKSGWIYSYGMGFWGPNGHDGIWHIALANDLAKGSFQMPVFAGEPLKNYHIGFDLLVASIHKFTQIPTINLYFQIFPLLIAFSTGLLTYLFVLKWQQSTTKAFWSTFFVYFGGSFGPLVTLIRYSSIGGESMFWAQQSISSLINPPFALSAVLMLCGLLLILLYKKNPSLKLFALTVLVFGILPQIKVYGGILAIGGLLTTGIYQLAGKRQSGLLKIGILSTLLGAALFIPLNKESNSLIVYQPFWFLENIMALSDRVGWPRFHEAMMNYKFGHIWHKAFLAYTTAFIIFLIGNMGSRIIAIPLVLQKFKTVKNLTSIDVFLLTTIVAGIVLPMLFLQRGTPWNTIQFFYYSLLFSGIFAGIAFVNFLSNKTKAVRSIATILLLVITLPTTYATLKHYLPSRPPAKISKEELEALNFLKKQPEGVVLTYPYNTYLAQKVEAYPPRPTYLYESTAYVSALSEKPTFLEDEVNLNITGYNWQKRKKEVEAFLATKEASEARVFLRSNNIKYIYWLQREYCNPACLVPEQRAVLGETQLGITQIFENKEVKVYQINQ